MASVLTTSNGQVTWEHKEGDQYVVTGVDRSNTRFKRTFDNFHMAAGINVWRGNRWLLRDGKRYKIQSVNN